MSFMQTNAIDVKQIEVGRPDQGRYWADIVRAREPYETRGLR